MSLFKSPAILLSLVILLMALCTAGLSTTPVIAQSAQPQFTTVAVEGEPAPAELGGTFSKIESSSVGNSGEVAFSADLAGSSVSSALLVNSGGANLVILRSGDGTPAGGTFSNFHEVDVVDGVSYLFRAEIQGIAPSEGVFLRNAQGELRTIQLAGDPTNGRYPGMTYKSFSQLTLIQTDPRLSPFVLNYAFVATLNEGGEAIVWNEFDTNTPPVTVEVSGPNLLATISPKGVIDHFALARLGSLGINFVSQYHKARKNREFDLPFYAQSEGELQYDPTLTEGLNTAIGKLKHIDVPISVNYSAQVFLAAQFVNDGQSSKAILTDYLACCSPFPLTAVLLTGDPAPGHPDQTIVDIGPPVANPVQNPPTGRLPSGLVAAVQLSNGLNALWVAVLNPGHKAEFEIQSILALLGGVTGDPSHPALTSFNPVKLTDTGKLLINGSSQTAGKAHDGVYLLSGLF